MPSDCWTCAANSSDAALRGVSALPGRMMHSQELEPTGCGLGERGKAHLCCPGLQTPFPASSLHHGPPSPPTDHRLFEPGKRHASVSSLPAAPSPAERTGHEMVCGARPLPKPAQPKPAQTPTHLTLSSAGGMCHGPSSAAAQTLCLRSRRRVLLAPAGRRSAKTGPLSRGQTPLPATGAALNKPNSPATGVSSRVPFSHLKPGMRGRAWGEGRGGVGGWCCGARTPAWACRWPTLAAPCGGSWRKALLLQGPAYGLEFRGKEFGIIANACFMPQGDGPALWNDLAHRLTPCGFFSMRGVGGPEARLARPGDPCEERAGAGAERRHLPSLPGRAPVRRQSWPGPPSFPCQEGY